MFRLTIPTILIFSFFLLTGIPFAWSNKDINSALNLKQSSNQVENNEKKLIQTEENPQKYLKDRNQQEHPDPSEAAVSPRIPAVFLPRKVFPDNVRQPSAFDILYPADKALLYRELRSLDRPQALPPVPGLAKTFIAPWGAIDGGLITAAKVYQYLNKLKGLKNVILLSRSHAGNLKGCSASTWPEGGYATPLGVSPINALATRRLLENHLFGFDKEAHLNEHSIETHILLIQYFLPDVEIIPVLISPRNKTELESIAGSLARILAGNNTVMIGISNLAYGIPTAEMTGTLDLKTISAISTMDLNIINNTGKERSQDLPPEAGILESPPTIMTTILASLLLEEDTVTWLGYSKSRQIPGSPLMTGYAAAAISERAAREWNDARIATILQRENSERLSFKASEEMLTIARDSLEAAAVMARYDTPYPTSPELLKKCAVFVTAYAPSGEVLSSMGTTSTAQRICNAVSDASRMCATAEDPQQNKRITSNQAFEAEIVVSILKDFQTIGRWDQVKNGMGVVIARGDNRALVLPITAKRNHWNVDDMLSFACKQSGLRPDAYRSDQIDIFTFYTDDYISSSRKEPQPEIKDQTEEKKKGK